jgi:hypothetical protein
MLGLDTLSAANIIIIFLSNVESCYLPKPFRSETPSRGEKLCLYDDWKSILPCTVPSHSFSRDRLHMLRCIPVASRLDLEVV